MDENNHKAYRLLFDDAEMNRMKDEEKQLRSDMAEMEKQRVLEQIKDELYRVRTYTPKVGIFGDSGVGKSSLCNALFGKPIAKISDVEACTREPQEIFVSGDHGHGIELVDVPGIGENPERHQEYMNLYQSLLPELDIVIWAVKADDRKFASSIEAYQRLFQGNSESCPIVFAITQVDKIEPFREWDEQNSQPGEKQQANIGRKIVEISRHFDTSAKNIVPVSSDELYNLTELVSTVIGLLPNSKKYSFARETKQENVSEETAKEAEKGVWDHVKEKIGDFWDYVKDDVYEMAKDAAIVYGPIIAKKAAGWISEWWKKKGNKGS